MEIRNIEHLYGTLPQAGALKKVLEDDSVRTVFLQGLLGSAAPMLFASLCDEFRRTCLFVLNDNDTAGYFYHDLTQILGTDRVLFFPSSYRRSVKYGQRDAANEILRTDVLARLSGGQSPYIVTYPEALAELVVSRKKLDERIVRLSTGQTVDIVETEKTLRAFGFTETDYVYEPGQFAVRGSILDVYSYSCELPFRIDFFGDEIDSIRTFEVESQLSKDRKEEIEIVPELSQVESEKIPFFTFLPADALVVASDLSFVCEMEAQVYESGFSSQVLTERLEEATEMERDQIIREMEKSSQLVSPALFREQLAAYKRIQIGGHPSVKPQASITFNTVAQPLFHKNFDLLAQTFDDYLSQGYTLYILADSAKQQQRLKEIFEVGDENHPVVFTPIDKTLHEGFIDKDLRACFFTDHQIFDRFHKYSLKSDAARAGKMALTMKELQELEVGDYLVHVDLGIGKFGGLVRVPLPATAPDSKGGYQEMIRIIYQHNDKVDVSIHSLYKISKYRRGDSEEPPRLSTLGTGAWERMKDRTKKRIKDIARDLIRLYAKRRREKGFAYSADSYMQQELEASFLYEDTPDQLKATSEVKADMERALPMDRLVCGDVGFGKTEVAVRAAFKAACDSKQVAVLVPTTVLAFQHYQTFRDRLHRLPVRVDYLSRARSAKQTKEILKDLEEGKIDILIGTHKLISKTVKWKDLGLLIIDEEQKFGVSTKERLRQLKTNVDTLTMSATPIPRTLQFSLMGARDMSIIRTPPPNRYPIHTEIASFGHEVITDAINFEMSRNGQVYFVCSRINNLQEVAMLIQKYIPDCRIAIGHGQMRPEELENIIMGFINYDFDVLLSTTIVENGIDIPNANTIIINDAHKFGLSDLHQMRGRVGRSNRKAFCYLLAPPKSLLKEDARRRLEALENFSELGSGFNLAMQDLDIRGAGNLLGAEQSGFMEDLGYETYLKILKEAMAELRNEASAEPDSSELCLARTKKTACQQKTKNTGASSEVETADLLPAGREDAVTNENAGSGTSIFSLHASVEYVSDCALESDLALYFPDTYVPGDSERMLLYRELDNIENDRELDAYRHRLLDRFGDIPHEGEELMQVVRLRRLGKSLGCEKIILKQNRMQMQFVSQPASPYYRSAVFDRVIQFLMDNPRRCNLKELKGHRSMVVADVGTVGEAVGILRKILGEQ